MTSSQWTCLPAQFSDQFTICRPTRKMWPASDTHFPMSPVVGKKCSLDELFWLCHCCLYQKWSNSLSHPCCISIHVGRDGGIQPSNASTEAGLGGETTSRQFLLPNIPCFSFFSWMFLHLAFTSILLDFWMSCFPGHGCMAFGMGLACRWGTSSAH